MLACFHINKSYVKGHDTCNVNDFTENIHEHSEVGRAWDGQSYGLGFEALPSWIMFFAAKMLYIYSPTGPDEEVASYLQAMD